MARYQPVPIRLGSVDSKSNVVRDFGRAGDVRNVDIEKTNEISRRRGYLRRLDTQLSGPVRILHSFGGLCGRFYSYTAGGGLIYISGTQGSGGLRETLDMDTQYPADPDDVNDPTEIGSGEGNAGNTETPGGAGTTTTDDGADVATPGLWRTRDDVSNWSGSIDGDADSDDFSFSFTSSLDSLNTVSLEWAFTDTANIDATGAVYIYRLYGTGDVRTEGTLIRTETNLSGSFTDTVDEYSDDIQYAIVWGIDGVGAYGPYSPDTISQQFRTHTLTLPAGAGSGSPFDMVIQGVHWTGDNDTSYVPPNPLALTISEEADSISPTTTAITGWSSGAKTVSTTLTVSSTDTVTITVVDVDSGVTGSGSLTIAVPSMLEDFSGSKPYGWDTWRRATQMTFSGGTGTKGGLSADQKLTSTPSSYLIAVDTSFYIEATVGALGGTPYSPANGSDSLWLIGLSHRLDENDYLTAQINIDWSTEAWTVEVANTEYGLSGDTSASQSGPFVPGGVLKLDYDAATNTLEASYGGITASVTITTAQATWRPVADLIGYNATGGTNQIFIDDLTLVILG